METIGSEIQNKRYCMIVKRKEGSSSNNTDDDNDNNNDKDNDKDNVKDNDNDKSNVDGTGSATDGDEKSSDNNDDDNDGNKNNKDEIYMYRPSLYHEMPKHNIPEWGFQAAMKDVLPASKSSSNNKYKEAITAQSTVNGKMFLLSLQKNETNEIRAWLFNRRQYCRFYTSDILNVLPHLFVKNNQNKLEKKHYLSLKSRIKNHSIPDIVFDKFSHTKHNDADIISFDDFSAIQ